MGAEAYLAIASQRDTRYYADRPIPEDLRVRTLEAARVAGSGMNRQDRRFILVEDAQAEASKFVTRPPNIETAAFIVAVAVPVVGTYAAFDAARAAQNMMITAWSEGVSSCPNALADPEAMAELLGLADGERVATLVSFGYPANGRTPADHSADEWLDRADRRPIDEMVERR